MLYLGTHFHLPPHAFLVFVSEGLESGDVAVTTLGLTVEYVGEESKDTQLVVITGLSQASLGGQLKHASREPYYTHHSGHQESIEYPHK